MELVSLRERFKFMGYGLVDSFCQVEIYKDDTESYFVIMKELADNPGTSITNVIESLATQIYVACLEDVEYENITWIEHYQWPKDHFGGPYTTYDYVRMEWKGTGFVNPEWVRIPFEKDKPVLIDLHPELTLKKRGE